MTSTGVVDRSRTLHIQISVPNDFKSHGIARMCRLSGFEVDAPGDSKVPADVVIFSQSTVDAEAANELLATHRAAGTKAILMFSKDQDHLDELVSIDCDGFIDEGSLCTSELESVVCQVMAGNFPMPPDMVRGLFTKMRERSTRAAEPTPQPLTDREQRALELMVAGHSNKQIARRMNTSTHGTKRLVANILAKLNCSNRTHAVAKAFRDGLCVATEDRHLPIA